MPTNLIPKSKTPVSLDEVLQGGSLQELIEDGLIQAEIDAEVEAAFDKIMVN